MFWLQMLHLLLQIPGCFYLSTSVCSVPGMESFQPLRVVDLLVLGVCPLPIDLLVLGVSHEYMHAILVISHVCMPTNACS